MRDRQVEALYYPQELVSPQSLGTVLCVAPHPDDEVFGAGGLLALLADLGRQPKVLILSRGESAAGEPNAAMAAEREQESRRAAAVLGLEPPRLLDWPDRGMRYAQPLVDCIASAIDEWRPEVLLLPALSEPHPDHQAVALAGLAAAQRGEVVRTLLLYEVGAPMHPNALVDITGVAERKWSAMRQFASQEAIQPYESQARALAVLRAFGRGPACAAAEAFFRVEVGDVRRHGAAAALPWWPMERVRQQLALAPEQLPLVSVLVRSMGRPQLAEAVASIAAQTYPNLEVVVLNASGRAHDSVVHPPGRLALRLVQPGLDEGGAPQPCDRARAANLALRAARGELALFVDEDDLIQPAHVERLVAALARNPRAVAAYAGVRVEGPDGAFLRDYDLPWSPQRLQGINFLPIHAVLFRLDRVREAGLAFDEALPVLEDWEFWRRLAALGDFVHCPGVSALYRQAHGDSGIGNPDHPHHWKPWHRRLVERSLAGSEPAAVADLLAWHAVELDRVQTRLDALARELDRQRDENAALGEETRSARAAQALAETGLAGAQAELTAARAELAARSGTLAARSAELADLQARNGDLGRERDLLQRELQAMKGSRSWRLTRPLRAFNAWRSARRG
jgi:LmbE family N-acetylglucosaminyl deacetylase